jgi:regulator of PEP synthase PpsR (kinase-PPPase family)
MYPDETVPIEVAIEVSTEAASLRVAVVEIERGPYVAAPKAAPLALRSLVTVPPEVGVEVRMRDVVRDLTTDGRYADRVVLEVVLDGTSYVVAPRDIQRDVVRQILEHVDLIGSLMGTLSIFMNAQPRGVPGGMYKVNDDYFRRIEAVEFAVKNDDGQHPRNLARSDIVLVGISRTSKTPLSTYLAQRGFKCANVPIVKGIEPPTELFAVDQDKIFGLQIASEALFRIRQARLQQLGMPADTAYGMKDHIQREIDYAQQIFDANPHWPVLDVTDKAIEETAATMLAIRAQREERRRNHR